MDLSDIRANRRNALYELRYRITDRLEASSDRDFASLSLRLIQVIEQIAEIETIDAEESLQETVRQSVEVTSSVVSFERGKQMRELVEKRLKESDNG